MDSRRFLRKSYLVIGLARIGGRKLLKKVFSRITLILLLVCLVTLAFNIRLVNKGSSLESSAEFSASPADWPSVYFCNGTVCNETFIGNVGDTINIALVAFNLTDNVIPCPENPLVTCPLGNLNGFDIQMSWDPTILQYVSHTLTVPVEDYPYPEDCTPSPYAGILHADAFQIKNVVDESASIPDSEPGTMAWFAYAIMPGAPVFNGNGTFFTMTFNVTKSGSSVVKLTNVDLSGDGGTVPRVSRNTFDCRFSTADAPEANFAFAPDIGVENRSVTFDASASFSPLNLSISKYSWDFDDGNITTVYDPVVKHAFEARTLPYSVLLVVEDSDGVQSSPATHELTVVEKRNVKIKEVSLTPAERVLLNRTVDVEVHVVNDGGADENFTLKAYYNATFVDWGDVSAADWKLIGEMNVSLPYSPGYSFEHFTWNTTGVEAGVYYYILVNATEVPDEEDATDNSETSAYPILVSSKPLSDVVVETSQFGWGAHFKSPVLDGEETEFQIIVLNNGTDNEVAVDVKLYCNGSVLKNWIEPIPYGETVELTWEELLVPNYYNITTVATIENDFQPDNNFKTSILQVIRTPQLNFSYSPEWALVNQTVLFDGSASFHRESGALITQYKWEMINPSGTTVNVYQGDLVNMTYTFDESGAWRVVLSVTDSYGISYDRSRPATSAYRLETGIDVEEGTTYCFEAGKWNNMSYFVRIISNSTVSDFYFSPNATPPFIEFKVGGLYGNGVCQVAFPKELLWVDDGWSVTVNWLPVDCTVTCDENYTYLNFAYQHSTNVVKIYGTHVIPEFPSFLIPPLFMIATLLAVIVYRRKQPF